MKICGNCKGVIDLINQGYSCSGDDYFHSPKCPKANQPSGAGFIAAEQIITDIKNRGGLGDEWDLIDANTQADIKHTWALIITGILDMQAVVIKNQAGVLNVRG